LLGNSAHGKNRASGLVKKHNFVDQVRSLSHHFQDSGIFGVSIEGAGSHSADLLSVTLEELNRLKDRISDEELLRAKNQLKMQIHNIL
jgi:predicted Zn-dependent peptidase